MSTIIHLVKLPESFTSNDAQVKELQTLRDLALKAELEIATIVGIRN
jgi:hypothetical protein